MTIRANFQLYRDNGDHQDSFSLESAFEVPASGITAIFGASGCGKTTLLRCIAGLEPTVSGRIQVNDITWQDATTFIAPYKRAISYVFQEPSLFAHLSVRQNIEYGYQRRKTSQKNINIAEVIALLNIQPLLARQIHGLSGGEQQRVAIARALLSCPELLLMDEPLSALDEASKAEILPFLQRLHQELSIPIFYVSHATDEVAYLADHVLLMQQGKISLQGSLTEVLADINSPLAQRQDMFSMLECEVSKVNSDYQLTQLRINEQLLYIPRITVNENDKVRLRIQARDVSICLNKPQDSSILNIVAARIEAMSSDSQSGQRLIRLAFAETVILARVSEMSYQRLQLKVGLSVYAQIKAIALL